MQYQTLYIMVRVAVQSGHPNIADTVNEEETQATFSLNDTPNVKILETEILLTRVRNTAGIHSTPKK